jgi:hypothetical protein
MPTEDFEVKLDSPHLHPEGVSGTLLAEFLRDWEKAVQAESALDEAADADHSDSPLVALVSVRDGCAAYGLKHGPYAGPPTARIIRGLANRGDDWAGLTLTTQAAIGRAIRRFTAHDIPLAINSRMAGVPSVSFTKDAGPPEVNTSGFVESPTRRSVKVLKAGGVRPAASVELLGGGERIPVQGPKRLIQELGRHLYQRVVLDGYAQWRLRDWKLVHFRVTRIDAFPGDDPAGVLAEVASASGDVWGRAGGIEGFLAEVRGDDEDDE